MTTTWKTIHSLEDIPVFDDEDDEAAFWESHELSEELLRTMPPAPAGTLPPKRQPEPIRADLR
ncbi:MAG: hypothetical protein ACYDCQ_09975 [Dehalococcoidia bacterium]